MQKTSLFLFAFLIVSGIPGTVFAQLSDQVSLEDFLEKCSTPQWLTGEPDWPQEKLLTFGPMRERTEAERIKGVWQYIHTTADERYPAAESGRYAGKRVVSLSEFNDLWLLAAFPRPEPEAILPEYLWVGISVPRAEGSYSGQINRHSRFTDSAFFKQEPSFSDLYNAALTNRVIERDDYQEKTKDVLVYLRRADNNTPQLDTFWRMSLAQGHSQLVEKSRDNFISARRSGAYEHFFTYVELPADRIMHYNWQKGHRELAKKEIRKTGTAYAYIMDSAGSCLASAAIQIVE